MRSRRTGLGLILALTLWGNSAQANRCNVSEWGDAKFGRYNWEWDPSTYHESLVVHGPTGTVKRIWDLIKTSEKKNCSKDSMPWSVTYTSQDTESIQHSMTGELKGEVGLKVGAKDVVDVNLSHAYVDTNNWQYVTTYSNTFTDMFGGTLGGCSGIRVKLKGKYLKGDHKGDGHVAFSVSARPSFSSWSTYNATCKDTTSSAKGQKTYVSYAWRADPFKPDCGDACKGCKTVTTPE